jgi:hypothetical protein
MIFWQRALDWLLARQARKGARESIAARSVWQRETIARARSCFELAAYAEPLPGPGRQSSYEALVLLRGACIWLLAYDHPDAQTVEGVSDALPAALAGEEGRGQPGSLRELLRRGVLDDERQERPQIDVDRAALRALALELFARREAPERQLARGVRAAWSRIVCVLATTTVVFVGATVLASHEALGPDLANGRPWKASSALMICDVKHATCGGKVTEIFFHTQEETSPWVSFDLGASKTVRRVDVRNRVDCCQERAVPLVVEVSEDEQQWTEVAARDETFSHWTARFVPIHARFVRLRVAKTTTLHLEGVAIR